MKSSNPGENLVLLTDEVHGLDSELARISCPLALAGHEMTKARDFSFIVGEGVLFLIEIPWFSVMTSQWTCNGL